MPPSAFPGVLVPAIAALIAGAPAVPLATASTLRCSIIPGRAIAVVHVDRDTTLPFSPPTPFSSPTSGLLSSPRDSLLAQPGTPLPAARVRLVHLDSATRAALAAEGVRDPEPVAFLRAAPYRADCRTVRWTDSVPFAIPGETGFVRASLAPRKEWVQDTPVLVVRDAWQYPYPRRRSLAFRVAPDAPLASAEALFDLTIALESLKPVNPGRFDERRAQEAWAASAAAQRARALEWARANLAEAEREPIRSMVRSAVFAPDWTAAAAAPSRLRGTYRVTMESGGARTTWFFRTFERPGYQWPGRDSARTIAELVATPHVEGYRLVGYGDTAPDSLATAEARAERIMREAAQRGERTFPPRPLVWFSTEDRPTAPGNDRVRALPAMLEFTLAAAPAELWDALEPFVPGMSAMDSAFFARTGRVPPRGARQPRIPITVRIDDNGGVGADTTVAAAAGRTLHVVLTRVDTLVLSRR